MKTILKKLTPEAREEITAEKFRLNLLWPDDELDSKTEELERDIPLDEMIAVVAETMKECKSDRVKSDAYLAPRLHATLRLTRREAADPAIWDYLSVVVLREYVIWRWGNDLGEVHADRIRIKSRGREIRHALSRLWWVAELSRNGPDYSPTEIAFSKQETVEWFVIRALRNRPAAQAFIRFISSGEKDKPSTDQEVRKLATALNLTLVTNVLDSIAPDDGPFLGAVYSWIDKAPDATLMRSELPEGPEDPVEEADIQAVESFLERIWAAVTVPLGEAAAA